MSARRFNRNERDARQAPPAPIAEVREVVGPDVLANGKKDWSRYNATVVGAVYVPGWHIRKEACLPGISLEGRKPYKNVFFGAEREWANDDEGWTHVGRSKKALRRAERKKRGVRVQQERVQEVHVDLTEED